MSTPMQTIPRTIVRSYLKLGRLPLDAAGSVLNKDGAEDWAPALAFDSVEATVLQTIGSFLKDDELVTQGRLAEARVAQLRRAAELEAQAEAKRVEADADYRERVDTDQERRQRVENEADQREAALAREKATKQREADQKARKQADAAQKIESVQQKAVAKQDRAARLSRVEAEQEALADETRAVQADQAVLDLDKALRTTKAVRKNR